MNKIYMINTTHNRTPIYKQAKNFNPNAQSRSVKSQIKCHNKQRRSKSVQRILRREINKQVKIRGKTHQKLFRGKGKMSEQLIQVIPQRFGKYLFYRLGETTINQLKKARIIPIKNYGSIGKKKPDGIIVCRGTVHAIVESKTSEELNTTQKEDRAIKQEIFVANALCKLLLVTDNQSKTLWINALNGEKIFGKNGTPIDLLFDSKLNVNPDKIESLLDEIQASITQINSMLKEDSIIDPTQLATRMWQTIWVATGKSPVKCLYNVVELLIFKFLSDIKHFCRAYPHRKRWGITARPPETGIASVGRLSCLGV